MKAVVNINEQMEVDVDPREVIQELLTDYDRPETIRAAQSLVNRSYVCLRAVPDELIEEMHPNLCQIVVNGLREQADRYAKRASEALAGTGGEEKR